MASREHSVGWYMILVLTCCLVVGTSCHRVEMPVYSQFEKIPSDGWDPADQISFEPLVADSTLLTGRNYRQQIVIRYSSRRSIRSFPVVVTAEDENGVVFSDTVRAELFDHSGRPAGTGNYGVYELVLLTSNIRNLQAGYAVTVQSLVDKERTAGVLNVGLMMWPELTVNPSPGSHQDKKHN